MNPISLPNYDQPSVPFAPRAIEKGKSLAVLLGQEAIAYLARNIQIVEPEFNVEAFVAEAATDLEPLALMDRGRHIANALFSHLPKPYERGLAVLVKSMASPQPSTTEFGLAGFFYLPHSFFIAQFGISPEYNEGKDPFDSSMQAQHALTQRFSAEFCLRPFIIADQKRTLEVVYQWLNDDDTHVRRLCSEGTRPKLPWGLRLKAFVEDPNPLHPILDTLKDDPELYVRRSVANSLGDISKDNEDWVFALCEAWLDGASKERKWLIRHAVRYHAKKGHPRALALREKAK